MLESRDLAPSNSGRQKQSKAEKKEATASGRLCYASYKPN